MKFVNWHNSKAIPKPVNFKTSVRMTGIGYVMTRQIQPCPHFMVSLRLQLWFIARMSHLQRVVEESIAALRGLSGLEAPLNQAAQLVLDRLVAGRKLLVCGNGGSASDATHLATEFLCRFREDRRPYPAISLTANGELMTAVCNDYHADEIFARQVRGLAEKGDVLIAISTSGKSKNILRALEEARLKGADSIAFLGRDGGFTRGIATIDLIVPGTVTARIQEAQKILFHALCEMVEEKLPKA
jgi:phosphoheptose isomerase